MGKYDCFDDNNNQIVLAKNLYFDHVKFNAKNINDAIIELGDRQYWNGFDRYNPSSMGVLRWDDTTRTFSIEPSVDKFTVWISGKKREISTKLSVQIPDVSGSYYIYIDNNNELKYIEYNNTTKDIFWNYALVGFVYWNKTKGYGLSASEQHGIRMSGMTHMYNHYTSGAKYGWGLNIEGLAKNSEIYTKITGGQMWDEDINHKITDVTTHKFMWREGNDGEWTISSTENNEIAYKKSGDTYYSWNEWDGSTWKLTQGASDSDYWIMFYVAFPNIYSTCNIYKILGQNAYPDRSKARHAIEKEIYKMTTDGLPNVEILWLYAVIVKRNGKLQTLSDGSTYHDLRFMKGVGTSSKTSDLIYNYTPTDSSDTYGYEGNIAYDDNYNYIYVKTVSGWQRAALSTF